MSVPTQMKAIVAGDDKTSRLDTNVAVPQLEKGEILIKVEAVTLNPTDWKHVKFMSPPGVTIGCDFAGTVVAAESTDLPVQKGDKVAGMVHGGMSKQYGSFAEYVKTDGSLVVKVPQDIGIATASSIGIAGYTAAQVSHKHAAFPQ
jgi:NADPH:quinone reductase-like Zn-dependent oxidoreductase